MPRIQKPAVPEGFRLLERWRQVAVLACVAVSAITALVAVAVPVTVAARQLGSHRYLGPLSGLEGPVSAVAFSQDGETLATATTTGRIQLWDATSGESLSASDPDVPSRFDGGGQVSSLAFSPDGESLVAGVGGTGGPVRVWTVETGEARTLGNTSASAAAGPSAAFVGTGGDRLAVATTDGVRILEVPGGREVGRLADPDAEVVSLAVSRDGSVLAAGRGNGTIQLWNVRSGRPTATLRGHIDAVPAVAFSPDGRTLASGGADGTTRLWSLPAGTQAAMLTGHNQQVRSLAFSPDGSTLASAGPDSPIRLWDVGGRRALAVLSGHRAGAAAVAFSPDGRTLASGGVDATTWLSDVSELPS